jgi:protein-arginine kinase activator protein McsA
LIHLELNRASEMGHHEKRIVAITNACAEFDHADDIKHNIELKNGAARVLTKMLSTTDDEDEIRMVCAATEMVFRADMTYVHVAFDKCGSVMIPTLLRIMERAERGNMKHAGRFIDRGPTNGHIACALSIIQPIANTFMSFDRH